MSFVERIRKNQSIQPQERRVLELLNLNLVLAIGLRLFHLIRLKTLGLHHVFHIRIVHNLFTRNGIEDKCEVTDAVNLTKCTLCSQNMSKYTLDFLFPIIGTTQFSPVV